MFNSSTLDKTLFCPDYIFLQISSNYVTMRKLSTSCQIKSWLQLFGVFHVLLFEVSLLYAIVLLFCDPRLTCLKRIRFEPIIILSLILLNFSSGSQDYFLNMDTGKCVFALISVANTYPLSRKPGTVCLPCLDNVIS